MENGNLRSSSTTRERKWPGASFWTREILEKLMSSDEGSEHEEHTQMDGFTAHDADEDGLQQEVIPIKEQFLKMVGDHGGELAKDVVKAFWQTGFVSPLQPAVQLLPTQVLAGKGKAGEKGEMTDTGGAFENRAS